MIKKIETKSKWTNNGELDRRTQITIKCMLQVNNKH